MARDLYRPDAVSDLPLFSSPPAQDVVQLRDRILERQEQAAGPNFALLATAKILTLLDRGGEASGEDLVAACRRDGTNPPRDDRAFGPIFMRLLRERRIERVRFVPRAKGHGTQGGSIYRRGPER
jgi:hypothetical protein